MSTPGITVDGNNTSQSLYGTRGDDSMSGMGGNDYLYSGMGNDVVYGGDGIDMVYVDFGDDWYHGGYGMDTLSFQYLDSLDGPGVINLDGVTFDLAKRVQDLGQLGRDTFYGFEHVQGSDGNDRLYGDGDFNQLTGQDGNDRLNGRGGDDGLFGWFGRDTLVGEKGADTLCGYSGGVFSDEGFRDIYRYLSKSESGTTASTRDEIWGFFNGGGTTGDKIDISRLHADTFKFIGADAFGTTAKGEVRVSGMVPNVYLVEVDTDSDAKAEISIVVHSANTLVKGDFLL